jgi:CHAT domain-containing protein
LNDNRKAVTTLTRADASEQRLDELRKAGGLKRFRYLHFATHGQANNVRAVDSALILTKSTKLPEPRVGEPYLDGRLTAAEVLECWQLDAELVTLSACESGLGRQGGGDGLLGFAQASPSNENRVVHCGRLTSSGRIAPQIHSDTMTRWGDSILLWLPIAR